MAFQWKKNNSPYICLAPMAGYTDSAFRQIVKEIAPEVITFSEMVSSDGLRYNSRTNKNLMQFKNIERPFIVQLFGKVPENFAIAAKIVEQIGADGIDINMGCPANKVIRSKHGAALIKSPKLAQEIVKATVSSTNLAVSVKTRLGWEDSSTLLDFAKGIEDTGAHLLTIHGRTYKQAFGGVADWDPIYKVKQVLKIPVFGNGDIRSVKDAQEKVNNLDGFMVGRATFGNPWLMQELTQHYYPSTQSQKLDKPSNISDNYPTFWTNRLKPTILKHCQYAVESKGERVGMNEMRKHLAMYVKGLPKASELRKKLVLVKSYQETKEILNSIKN